MMITAFIPMEFVVTPETTYVLIGEQSPFRRISPTDATGARTSSQALRTIRLADGSMKTATASTILLRSKAKCPVCRRVFLGGALLTIVDFEFWNLTRYHLSVLSIAVEYQSAK